MPLGVRVKRVRITAEEKSIKKYEFFVLPRIALKIDEKKLPAVLTLSYVNMGKSKQVALKWWRKIKQQQWKKRKKYKKLSKMA